MVLLKKLFLVALIALLLLNNIANAKEKTCIDYANQVVSKEARAEYLAYCKEREAKTQDRTKQKSERQIKAEAILEQIRKYNGCLDEKLPTLKTEKNNKVDDKRKKDIIYVCSHIATEGDGNTK